MPQLLRSVLAVVAGFLAMAVVVMVLTVLSVKLLHLNSGHPTPVYLTLNVLYSLAAAGLGGWLCATIAARNPVAHGIALAVLIVVLSALSYKGGAAGGQPFWYRVFLILAPPLAAIAGAWLRRS